MVEREMSYGAGISIKPAEKGRMLSVDGGNGRSVLVDSQAWCSKVEGMR